MKKLAIIVFIFGAAGFSLHAQLLQGIGIGGWARYVIAPIGGSGTFGEKFTDENMYVRNQSNQNWLFPTRGKAGLAAWGNSDYVGFNFDFGYIDGSLMVGDQAKLWVQPHHTLMLHFGRIEGNKLRSGIIGGRLTYTEEENDIFTRFTTTHGMLIDYEPIENLYIGASINAPSGSTPNRWKTMYSWEADRNNYQIGAGYKFDFGHLRAQLLANDGGVWSGKPIQVAFAYTEIYNLIAEVGGLYPLKELDNNKNSPAKATVAAAYKIEQWDLMGRFTLVGYPQNSKAGTRVKIGGVVKYTVNFPLYLGAELAYLSDYQEGYFTQQADLRPPVSGSSGADLFQICPFAGFKYSKGDFRIGFHWEQNFRGDRPGFKFELPLFLEVNFL